jgi:gliding motility-associated-like protein
MEKIIKHLGSLTLGLFLSTASVQAHDHAEHNSLNTGISFIENKGQWVPEAKFKAEIPEGSLFLTSQGFVYNYISFKDLNRIHSMICGPDAIEGKEVSEEKVNGHAYKVNFIGSNQRSNFQTSDKHSTYSNYYIGNDSRNWASNVGHFGTVIQKDVYDGVDLKVYSNSNSSLKYDFIVAPNSDPRLIKLAYEGVKVVLTPDGNLRVKTSVNEIIEQAPYSYQIINGKEKKVESKYVLTNNVLSFEFPNGYDQTKPLVIDPNLIFATYSGSTGSTAKWANATTYDDQGNTYAGGLAGGTDWPVTIGAYQTTYAGSHSGVINKYSSDGTALLFSTYFGGTVTGSGRPMNNCMRVDAAGNLFVAGTVSTTTMPVTTGAYQSTLGGGADIFVAKFNSTGTALLASTYLGGSGIEGSVAGTTAIYTGNGHQANPITPVDIAFDATGNVWIAGNSGSTNFPVTANAYQSTNNGIHDAVLTKMNSDLTSIIYSTYLGGNGWDGGLGIEYNANNNTVGLVGYTASTNFPTTSGVYHPTSMGGIDGYAVLMNNANYQVAASTYLGTASTDFSYRLAFDCGNNFFVAGRTQGAYPVTNTVAQGLVPNGYVFIDKLNPNLSASIASTRTGAANASILPTAMMVDLCGNILVATLTNNAHQSGMPLTADAFQTAPRGFYFAGFEPNFTDLAFGSYYGSSGSSDHHHPGIASRIDPKGIIYQSLCYLGSNGTWQMAPANVYAPNKLNGSNNDIVTFKFDFEVLGLDADAESGYAGYGNIPHAVRGCKSAFINYTRNGDTTVPMVLRFNILSGGAYATNGVDYEYVADSLVFGVNERTKGVEIKPLLVPNMPTGPKMVVIESLNPCGCNGGTGDPIRRDTVYILDSIRVDISEPLPAYCPGTQITITADVDPELDFSWTPADVNNGSLTINPILLTTRDYTITAYQPGAPATCPPATRTFHAYVEQYPIIQLSSDTTVCVVDSIALPVVVSPDSVNYLFNWSPATGLRAADLQTNFFSMPVGSYTYTVTATTPLANCSATHNVTIHVRPPFQFTNVTPPSGTIVNYLDEVQLNAEGALLYNWMPSHLFMDPTMQNPTTLPITEPGTYYVSGVDHYGCRDTAAIFLDVKYPYDPIMPNAFTPNGDGKNDIFSIPNGKYQKILKFEVYDRWGQQVFNTVDPNKGWDGTNMNNGSPCNQGTYMYVIAIELPNKEIKTYKGDVTLMR